MAKRKVRNYESVDVVRNRINNYFETHHDEVIQHMVKETGFDSFDDLWDAEYHMAFGLDCGWVWVYSMNKEQRHEWALDNGKYDAYVTMIKYPYNTQSTTCKEIQLNKALKDLNMDGQYMAYVRLD